MCNRKSRFFSANLLPKNLNLLKVAFIIFSVIYYTRQGVNDMQGRETLLLIDDDEDILSVTRMILEGSGFTILTANNGRKGVEIFRENIDKIKAVLIDLVMPEMDGREVFHELKKISNDVKAILVCGHNNEEIKRYFCDDGFFSFIQKPYDVEYLLIKIRSI